MWRLEGHRSSWSFLMLFTILPKIKSEEIIKQNLFSKNGQAKKNEGNKLHQRKASIVTWRMHVNVYLQQLGQLSMKFYAKFSMFSTSTFQVIQTGRIGDYWFHNDTHEDCDQCTLETFPYSS